MKDFRPRCADCRKHGVVTVRNVCADNDGVLRCHPCSKAVFDARRVAEVRAILGDYEPSYRMGGPA